MTATDQNIKAEAVAREFTALHVVELVHAEIATATTECVVAGSRTIEVARVRITEAGRRALERGNPQ